ncbi:MAG: acetyltransferase [Acidobacteriia bacterium]|nr:acetyltransferase [Terriglobia bacterium]MBV9745627.1 acetyltransferase [Terriglobia bacterium]
MATMRSFHSWLLYWRYPGVITLAASALSAQGLMPGGMFRLFTSDAAILESQEIRKDLPCVVNPVKPALGFDLKFHSGYSVTIPLKELAGEGNQLTMVFRVTAVAHPDEQVYLSQRMSVPVIPEDAKGEASLQGSFNIGDGKYHVDWLMRDRNEHVCSSNWDIEANLPPKDREMPLDIGPNMVEAADAEPFKEEPPIERAHDGAPLNVKVMVNFAPQNAYSAALQPLDTNALVSILRNIAREPRIGRFSIVAFNMQEQRVIYRQNSSSQIDFPALGEALHSLSLGTIDFKKLGQKHADSEFLTNLIASEIKDEKDQPDAVIIAGPKVMLDDGIPQEPLKQVSDLHLPLFYMNYNLNPQATPWRDAIGSAVKYLKGAEYTITRPRDLFFAWTEIMGRIVKSKFGRIASSSQ